MTDSFIAIYDSPYTGLTVVAMWGRVMVGRLTIGWSERKDVADHMVWLHGIPDVVDFTEAA